MAGLIEREKIVVFAILTILILTIGLEFMSDVTTIEEPILTNDPNDPNLPQAQKSKPNHPIQQTRATTHMNQTDYRIRLHHGWWWKNGSKMEWDGQERYTLTIRKGEINQNDFKFTLENLGNSTFINYSVSAPYDWVVIPPNREFWLNNTNSSELGKNLSLTVFPSMKLKYLPSGKLLRITLKAFCESDSEVFDTLDFIIKINFIPGPKIVLPEPPEGKEIYSFKPDYNFMNFSVFNMGNGEDNFEIDASVDIYSPSSWGVTVYSGKYTRILQRGGHQIITIRVFVPPTVRAGASCGIKLTATSVKDPGHRDGEKNLIFYIFADLYKNVTIDSYNDKAIPMYPNSETSTMLRVRNTGNKADKSIWMNVTSIPEGWDVIVDSSDIPPGGLPRNGTAEIEVIINTPKKVVESKYEIKIAAMGDEQIRDEVSLVVQVLKVRKLTLHCKNARKSGNVSEKISYLITVENNGNAHDTFEMDYSYVSFGMREMNWKVKLSKNWTTINPYESSDVIVTLFIPLEAEADTDFLTLTLNGYFIQIKGISQNDTRVNSHKEIEIVVNPYFDFSLDKQKDEVFLFLNNEKAQDDYSFSISNLGNDIDEYDVTYDSEYDWLIIPSSQNRILPGETQEIFMIFDIP